ncbi:MAG: riboflavin synthase [Elusimicrobiales bacterium]|nr:riboflavin synthase [Elusimicrobiales bacterium]
MFTGIIEAQGRVLKTVVASSGGALEIKLPSGWTPALGESIAVNGACLTVTAFSNGAASFDASPETLEKSTVASLRPGMAVNLERALQSGARFGGHIVTGHVDGKARLESALRRGEFTALRFSAAPGIMADIVAKGSVALDGISLTVSAVSENGFEIAVIPHTLENSTLGAAKPGGLFNIETDILAKYVRKSVAHIPASRITEDFLRENGFF